jgi:pyrroline-5-carboxylate reductase
MVFMLIEAMADAAVLMGLTRTQAYKIAAKAVEGSAKMVSETGAHPAVLKDRVCSPGGTTIEMVAALEESAFRGGVIAALDACYEKCGLLSQKK